MAIIGRHIETAPPYNGLPPRVLNLPCEMAFFPKASASNAVWTTANHFTATNNNNNVSVAPATQPDYARNVVLLISPNTASSSLYSAGTVQFYGRDVFGSTRSESFALTAMNTNSSPTTGSINFASLDSISFVSLKYHTASSSAASAVSFYAGVGQKLGLPVALQSSDAVYKVVLGTAEQRTSSGANSTNNLYTVVTGDYHVGGIKASNAYASNSLLQIGYNNLGFRGPVYGV